MTRRVIRAIAVLVFLPLGTSAQTDRVVPFTVGETLTYDVSWSSFLTAGTATIAVRERRMLGPARAAYVIVAEGRPGSLLDKLYHLYYKADALLDTRTLLPIEATVFSDEAGRTKNKFARFKPDNSVDYELRTTSLEKSSVKVAPKTEDPIGALYALRAMPLRNGQLIVLPVLESGTPYEMRVQVGNRETLRTPMGTISAWRLVPTLYEADGKPAADRQIIMWLSDDARRLPLRFEVGLTMGSFVLTLSKVAG